MNCIYCKALSREISRTLEHVRWQCRSCRRIFTIPLPPSHVHASFRCINHQGKANALVSALSSRYRLETSTHGAVRFVLSDSDVMGRRGQLERMRREGTRRFFVYPHSARPSMINDHYPTWDGTTAQFVVNEHHAEVLRRYGYTKPLVPIGWYLSEVREFQAKPAARRVLFAPIHPRNAPIDRKVNAETWDRLYPLHRDGVIELTVRYIGHLADNGLPFADDVRYVKGEMNQTVSDQDAADVVIAHQTYAWIAVARGVPCVMMAEDMPTHFRRRNHEYDNVKSWDMVKDIFQFPLDILEENDTIGLLNRAVSSDCEIADWKRRMIGEAFDAGLFAEKVDGLL